MKILVCLSAAPDTTSKVSFKNGDTEYNTDGVQYILNPYDEWYALVKALEIKEAQGGSVTVIHVGLSTNDSLIRKSLAIGADDAIRIDSIPLSSEYTAKQIVHYAHGYDIVLLGKEVIDYQSAETGAMLAELLEWPFVSFVSKMEVNKNTLTCHRDIEGGVEILEVDTPVVISASKGMAEQRIPNMKGIMSAKSKPLAVQAPKEVSNHIQYLKYDMSPTKKGVHLIAPDEVEELVNLLHETEKLI